MTPWGSEILKDKFQLPTKIENVKKEALIMIFQRNQLVLVALCFTFSVCVANAEVAPIDPEIEPSHKARNDQQPDSQVLEDTNAESSSYFGASGSFFHGFIATLSVIIVSELGDKTFFIAAIMAMKHPRWTVFVGAMAALALMHVMSAFFGYAITVIPRVFTYYLSSFLFAVFGIKMLREGWKMSPNVSLVDWVVLLKHTNIPIFL